MKDGWKMRSCGAVARTREALMTLGLPVSLGDKDYDSAIFELEAEK